MVRSCLKGLFHCSIVLVSWGLLAPSTAIAKEQEEGPCPRGFAKIVFAPEHFAFPSSRDDIDPSTHSVFAEFAAEQANLVLDWLQSGKSISEIFANLAIARHQLAIKMRVPEQSDFGVPRGITEEIQPTTYVSRVPSEFYMELLTKKYKVIDHNDYFRDHKITWYTSTAGDPREVRQLSL